MSKPSQRPCTPAENLVILKARLSEHLSPAEKRELDEVIEHLRGAGQAVNQCDGCRMKAPLNEQGNHVLTGFTGCYPGELMGCTAHLYASPASAGQGQGAAQEWTPTHRHADGGLYRLLSDGKYRTSGSEWSDCMIYEDASGNRWATTPVRWADRFEEIGASAARPSATRPQVRRGTVAYESPEHFAARTPDSRKPAESAAQQEKPAWMLRDHPKAQCADVTKCMHMKETGGSMNGERYECVKCGESYRLDYDEMR